MLAPPTLHRLIVINVADRHFRCFLFSRTTYQPAVDQTALLGFVAIDAVG
jgi:hypothetical protein